MADDDARRPMIDRRPLIDWANSVSPADLAAELMAAFGPDELPSVRDLALWLLGAHGYHRHSFSERVRDVNQRERDLNEMTLPISEAVQLLEHAELVNCTHGENPRWRATRLGFATMASGKAAVRQRITDRTGL
jgi:hypothetical protein